jgi:16S rRNA (guanine966-N2)-methyltransferase
LYDNLDTLDLTERAKVVAADALSVASTIDADIVFADPPYDFDSWPELLGRVRADLVIAESGSSVDAPSGWTVTRDKKYGRTRVTFLERTGDPSAGDAAVGSVTQ